MPHFFWRDPEPDSTVEKPIEIDVESDAWRHYYAPVLDLIHSDQDYFERMLKEPLFMPVEHADIEIGIHPVILRLLIESRWDEVRALSGSQKIQATEMPYRADGIAVVAGNSWQAPFEEWEGKDI